MPRKDIPRVSMAEAIDAYCEEETGRGLDPVTVKMKRRTLGALARQTARGEHTATRNLAPHHFRDTIIWLNDGETPTLTKVRVGLNKGRARTGRKGSTLNLDRSTLRQFVELLHRRGWIAPGFRAEYEITATRAKKTEGEIREERIPLRVPYDQWPTLLDLAVHPRDRLLMALGLRWAQRASGMAIIQWGDLHRSGDDQWVELVNVKLRRRVGNGKLPLGPAVQRELDTYLAWLVPLYGEPQPEWPLLPVKKLGHEVANEAKKRSAWPVHPDRPMTPDNIGRNVKRILQAFMPDADLTREASHTLRRSGGRWIADNWGLAVAQRLLDHKSSAQTRAYVGWSKEDETLAEAMAYDDHKPAPPVTRKNEPLAKVIDLRTRKRVA